MKIDKKYYKGVNNKMMNKLLKNDIATVEINKMGAEVISFKRIKDNCEYMWNGDGKYWAGHSPVLFPIVCAVNNSEIRVDGKTYKVGNHGFARKSEFELVDESDTKAVYKLSYSEESLKMYPFKYDLYISYTLTGNKLETKYRVDNVDNKMIFFQIGTHPGFNCPLGKNENFEDYYLEFECDENLERLYMDPSNVIISGKSESILKNSKVLALTAEMFMEGALVFRNINSSKVTLKSKKTEKQVVLTYENFSYLGLWQAIGAPFVCIEPWHGIADEDNFVGEFKEKEMMINLKEGANFECSLAYEIG